MKKKLFIRPTTLSGESFHWLLQDSNRMLAQGYCKTPPVLRPAEWQKIKHVCILIPVSEVSFREIKLSSRKTPPLEWLVEDSLLTHHSNIHWTLLQRTDTVASLAGCDRHYLSQWIDKLCLCGLHIQCAYPDALLLPWQGDNLTIYTVTGHCWARYKPWQALCLEEPLFTTIMPHIPYSTIEFKHQFSDDLPGMLAFIVTQKSINQINLLRGFTTSQDSPLKIKKVKYTAFAFMVISLVSLLILPLFSAWHDYVSRQQSEKRILEIWHAYIPDRPTAVSPEDSFLQRQVADPDSFHFTIKIIDRLLTNVPAIQLEKIEFRQKPWQLKIHISTDNNEQLDKLIEDSSTTFKFEITQHSEKNLTLTARSKP